MFKIILNLLNYLNKKKDVTMIMMIMYGIYLYFSHLKMQYL